MPGGQSSALRLLGCIDQLSGFGSVNSTAATGHPHNLSLLLLTCPSEVPSV